MKWLGKLDQVGCNFSAECNHSTCRNTINPIKTTTCFAELKSTLSTVVSPRDFAVKITWIWCIRRQVLEQPPKPLGFSLQTSSLMAWIGSYNTVVNEFLCEIYSSKLRQRPHGSFSFEAPSMAWSKQIHREKGTCTITKPTTATKILKGSSAAVLTKISYVFSFTGHQCLHTSPTRAFSLLVISGRYKSKVNMIRAKKSHRENIKSLLKSYHITKIALKSDQGWRSAEHKGMVLMGTFPMHGLTPRVTFTLS